VSLEQSSTAFGLDVLVGDRRAYVNVTRGALLAEYHRLLPRDRVVVELLESVTPDAEVLAACRRMRAEGWRLALDDYAGEPEREPFLELVDVVKCDLVRWPAALEPSAIARLRERGLQTLAEKVETPEQAQAALAAGHALLQGYHFCRPEMIAVRDLSPAKTSVLRFMAEVTAAELSFERLEAVFRADVGLTVRLLRHLNSAAFGLRHEVHSVHHALELLGERPLRRWALMLGMMSLCEDRPHELLVTALSRARFAEAVAPETGLAEHGPELFLTGMLSLVDGMVGRPKPEVLSSLALPDEVRDAVLHRGSPYEAVLDLVTAYQHGDWRRVDENRARCPLDDRTLDEAYTDSLQWAEAVAA
jgi:EAL and modified HD-GYP domain-containing signal transduction protein